ncbi:MAG TPA: RidA family protein [Bauldia sp.]|nr:RidA family protein [Bauldia sp.]
MLRALAPTDIRPPFGGYSHGIDIPAGMRLVLCSGQLGVAPDDSVPPTVEGQAEQCFRNIAAILREAGLGLGHVVRLAAYVTRREDMRAYMAVRDRFVGAPPPPPPPLIVSGFPPAGFPVGGQATAAGPA